MYYQLRAENKINDDVIIEFKVKEGRICSKHQDETNVFTVKKKAFSRSPQFKLDIGIAAINELLSSKKATLRIIISVLRA